MRAWWTGWRTALRIAARESRRAKGRSALVLALIALPVLGMSFAAASYDMFRLTPAETVDRKLGAADALVRWTSNSPISQDPTGTSYGTSGEPSRTNPTTADLLAALPPGSRVVPVVDPGGGWQEFRTATGIGRMPVYGLDLTDPLTRGLATLVDGVAPVTRDQVALSEPALRRLGTRLGGTVELADGSRRWTVVGVVELPDNLAEAMVAPPSSLPPPLADSSPSWLVDTPQPVTWADVRRFNAKGMLVISRAVLLDPPPADQVEGQVQQELEATRQLSVGALIGGLAVLEVVLLAGPAFAVGAKRRRRDLALLAASGGTPAQQRRVVLADGMVLGLCGAVIGVVLGVAAALAGRPLVEEHLVHSRAGGYRVYPMALLAIAGLAVLTGLVAALVPAVTAARQDVLAGLTGRRGAIRSRRRWLVTGLVLATSGIALAGYGAWRIQTSLVLGGLILAELGLVLCTPSLVGLIARAGRLLPLAPRIALRDTARNRAAAAPAISAVMAAVAGTVALGIFTVSQDARNDAKFRDSSPLGSITVPLDTGSPQAGEPVAAGQVRQAAGGIPVTAVADVRIPACAPGTDFEYCGLSVKIPAKRVCPYFTGPPPTGADISRAAADPRCAIEEYRLSGPYNTDVVDDGTALPVLTGASGDDLRRAREVLSAGGVVVTDANLVVDGSATIEAVHTRKLPQGDAPPEVPAATFTVPAHVLTTGVDVPRQVYSPTLVRRAGLADQQWGVVLATAAVPTVAQQDAMTAALRELAPGLNAFVARGRPERGEDGMLMVLALAAGLLTIGAAGIATGLAAADSRGDLTTLAAVGASPRVRRVLSLSQAGTIAGLGSLLGLAAGLAAATAIIFAYNQGFRRTWPVQAPYPFTVPWTVLGVLVMVPLVAMAGAGLLTRSRLPIERRTG